MSEYGYGRLIATRSNEESMEEERRVLDRISRETAHATTLEHEAMRCMYWFIFHTPSTKTWPPPLSSMYVD